MIAGDLLDLGVPLRCLTPLDTTVIISSFILFIWEYLSQWGRFSNDLLMIPLPVCAKLDFIN
jgi:hypothetical protein